METCDWIGSLWPVWCVETLRPNRRGVPQKLALVLVFWCRLL